MTLVEDDVYLPVVVRKFTHPESVTDSLHIPRAVETFSFVSVSASVQFSLKRTTIVGAIFSNTID